MKKTSLQRCIVLVENDSLICHTWRFIAQSRGEQLIETSTLDDLLDQQLPSHAEIYIDWSLLNQVKFKPHLRYLKHKGLRRIFITKSTAHQDIPTLKDIEGILGKDYPR